MKTILFSILTYLIPFLFGFYYIDIDFLNINSNNTIDYINLNKFELFNKILLNNFQVITINILGFLTFGGLTLINSTYNGFILGIFFKVALIKTSVSLILYSFLPHSIEILGLIYSTYIGYNLSRKMYKFILKDINHFNKNDIRNIIICFLTILTSSILEVYISIK